MKSKICFNLIDQVVSIEGEIYILSNIIHNSVKQFCYWPKRCFTGETNSHSVIVRVRVVPKKTSLAGHLSWQSMVLYLVCSVCPSGLFRVWLNFQRIRVKKPSRLKNTIQLTLKMTSAQVVKTLVRISLSRTITPYAQLILLGSSHLLNGRLLKRRVATRPKLETSKTSPSKGFTLKSYQMLNIHTAIRIDRSLP